MIICKLPLFHILLRSNGVNDRRGRHLYSHDLHIRIEFASNLLPQIIWIILYTSLFHNIRFIPY